jgi:hypothetical protein
MSGGGGQMVADVEGGWLRASKGNVAPTSDQKMAHPTADRMRGGFKPSAHSWISRTKPFTSITGRQMYLWRVVEMKARATPDAQAAEEAGARPLRSSLTAIAPTMPHSAIWAVPHPHSGQAAERPG